MLESKKHFENKTDYVKEFGKDLGWKVEADEFVDVASVQGYQTADDTDEDAYPEPLNKKRLVIEKQDQSLEESYQWILQFMRYDLGYSQIDKIYDIFSSSESSAMFGNIGQKQGAQQDRATNLLRSIGAMIKDLFPLVRETRILDERLELYKNWKKSKSADITLKQHYVQFVEGGGQNPDSVYGLATRVGYTVLPDLFFNTHVHELKKIDEAVDNKETSEFNKNVKAVLKRKLYGYINWRKHILKETETKRTFQIKYIRQHWKAIELYMAWVKPYIKASQRMNRRDSQLNSPDLINAFDNTILEIEILGKKPIKIKNKHYKCILANFKYITNPILTYKQEWGQQAVAHSGKLTITLRAYAWHEDDIKAYKKMRQEEDLSILTSIDEHIGGAFEAMKEDIEKYLEEAGDEDALQNKKDREEKEEQEKEDAKEASLKHRKNAKWGLLEPFMDIGSGFADIGKSFFNFKSEEEKKSDKDKDKNKSTRNKNDLNAAKSSGAEMILLYQVYKKGHGHMKW